jgi:hypothetical protein
MIKQYLPGINNVIKYNHILKPINYTAALGIKNGA